MAQTKKKEKRSLPALLSLSFLFYGSMLLLSVFADDIHYARLPQVTASHPTKQQFYHSYVNDEGHFVYQNVNLPALPKDMVDSGQIFLLEAVSENNFTYYYVTKLSVLTDASYENTDYYAIINELNRSDLIVTEGYENLKDNDEVALIKKEKRYIKEEKDLFQ